MTLLIWAGFALGALLWTGGALAVTGLIHWAGGLLGSGQAAQLGQAVTGLPVPLWLTHWVDLETLHATLDGIAWTLESAQRTLPWLDTLLQWLLPLTWVLWALGLGLLLLPALGAQMLVRHLQRRRAALPAVAA